MIHVKYLDDAGLPTPTLEAVRRWCGGCDEDRQMWAAAWRRLAMQPAPGVPLARVLAFSETPGWA